MNSAERQYRLVQLLGHRFNGINAVAFSPDGKSVAGGGYDALILVWEAATGELLRTLAGHEDWVTGLAFSPDGRWLASGSDDRSVRLWEAATGNLLRTLEGHEGGVTSLAFSPDGRWLASGSIDRSVRLWEPASGEPIEVHSRHPAKFESLGFVFISTPIHAKPFGERSIWLREIGRSTCEAVIVSGASRGMGFGAGVTFAKRSPTRITSAKVVLLGESQVGKSALALRLAEDRYEDQSTTHGMRIWTLSPEKLDPASAAPVGERREVVLWDLGGQDEYRLIHQLFIHDTELALMLLDPTRGTSAFGDVREWNARLECQRKGRPTTKLLVGSKLDGGDANVDRTAVEELQADCNALVFVPTSAKTDFGISALRAELARHIDWAALGQTRRPALFQHVRDEIDRLRQQGEVTLALADLREQVKRSHPGEFDAQGVDQVVDQLARQGAIADTRLASGEHMLVLQLGEIERYAGSLIFTAKEGLRTRGVPVLDEREIAHPDIEFPRIPRKERLLPTRERVVLECLMQLLIERGICLRQPGLLIFPSLFPVGDEGPIEGADSVSLYYDFTGPIDNLYATLVAQAALAERFGRVRMSPGRTEFEHPAHGLCGLHRKAQRSGRGHLDIFFSAKTGLETRQLFRRFVEDFLRQNGVNVTEAVQISCAGCPHVFGEADVRTVIEADLESVCCPLGHSTQISAAVLKGQKASAELESAVTALKTDIERRIEQSATDAKRAIGRVRVFVSYAHADEALRIEFSKHLSILKHEGVVEIWDDRQIGAGDEWESSIDARLDEAQIVLLLLSADFMSSRYCRLETARALRRRKAGEAMVIPVLLRPVDWASSELGQLQALPRAGGPVTAWPRQDEALLDVAQGVRRAVEVLLRTPTEQEVGKAAAEDIVIAPPERGVRILHLSDLHFGADTDPIDVSAARSRYSRPGKRARFHRTGLSRDIRRLDPARTAKRVRARSSLSREADGKLRPLARTHPDRAGQP